jgi:sec-independent protein translocase protein TatA
MGLFDSPWHILILLVVVLLLFGAKRLPGSARALGQSLRIFKAETRGLREDDPADTRPAAAAPQQLPASEPAAAPEPARAQAQHANPAS